MFFKNRILISVLVAVSYMLLIVRIHILHGQVEQVHLLEQPWQFLGNKMILPEGFCFLETIFRDKIPNPSFIEYDAIILEIIIGTHDGIWIYFNVNSHFSDRWNAVPWIPFPQQYVFVKVICNL